VAKDIRDLKDIHKGERCFVMGTGPSLKPYQLERLKKEITVSTNGIVFAQDEFDFHPTYFSTSEYYVFKDQEIWSRLKKTKSTRVISKFILIKAPQFGYNYTGEQRAFLRNSYLVDNKSTRRELATSPEHITLDLEKDLRMMGTGIMDVAIPLAFYLGCDPIYMVGCDCQDTGHFYKHKTDSEKELKHSGMPDTRVRDQYPLFKQRMDMENRRIINLTPIEASCPGIPKQDFDDII